MTRHSHDNLKKIFLIPSLIGDTHLASVLVTCKCDHHEGKGKGKAAISEI